MTSNYQQGTEEVTTTKKIYEDIQIEDDRYGHVFVNSVEVDMYDVNGEEKFDPIDLEEENLRLDVDYYLLSNVQVEMLLEDALVVCNFVKAFGRSLFSGNTINDAYVSKAANAVGLGNVEYCLFGSNNNNIIMRPDKQHIKDYEKNNKLQSALRAGYSTYIMYGREFYRHYLCLTFRSKG